MEAQGGWLPRLRGPHLPGCLVALANPGDGQDLDGRNISVIVVGMEKNNKIVVRGLPWSVRNERLGQVFEGYGEVVEARVIMDRRDPTRSRGYGFVTFADAEVAKAALEMDGADIDGRTVSVQFDRRPGPYGA